MIHRKGVPGALILVGALLFIGIIVVLDVPAVPTLAPVLAIAVVIPGVMIARRSLNHGHLGRAPDWIAIPVLVLAGLIIAAGVVTLFVIGLPGIPEPGGGEASKR